MNAAAPLLRTDRLTRRADGRAIVEEVTVEVGAGEVLAVVGTSGSGKSSLLRLLNRLDEPSAGTVSLRGSTTGDPMGAALFQFVTLALVLAAGGLTSLVCVRLLRARAFTSVDPLALPPSSSA